jgi:hypothetical protein
MLAGAEDSLFLTVRLRVTDPAVTARATRAIPILRKNPTSRTMGLRDLDMIFYSANFAVPEVQVERELSGRQQPAQERFRF